jgi:uncharacterized phosphatase
MRHGLSIYNQLGKFSGRIDSPLADEGRDDVRKIAETVKDLNIDTIISSPLGRALESAQIIADVIGYPKDKILVNNLFSERDFGVMEGARYQPLAIHDEIEEIETVEELIHRAKKGFDWLETLEAKNILLVSHGSLGRALRYIISQEFPFEHPSNKFHNAEIVSLI